MKVNLLNPSKQYDVNNEDAISEHKNEYISFSQSQKYRKKKWRYIDLRKKKKAWSWFR